MIKTTHALHHKELQSLGGGRHKPTITRSTSRVLGTLAFFPSKIAAEKDFYLGLQSTNAFHDHEDRTVTKSRVKPQAPPGSSRTWLLPAPSPLLNPQKDQGSPCTLRAPPHTLLVEAGICLRSWVPTCKRHVSATMIKNVIKK